MKIRERKGPSRGSLQKCAPHERSPGAPKFEERSHEETFCTQEGCARRAAWDSAKTIYKLKNSDKATFESPFESDGNAGTHFEKKIREREFVVDSRASMHMMSNKELCSDELDTLRRSRKPTVVLTGNAEVHTHEKAQVFVHDVKSIRDSAVTRGNTSSPVTKKTLRRPRMLL